MAGQPAGPGPAVVVESRGADATYPATVVAAAHAGRPDGRTPVMCRYVAWLAGSLPAGRIGARVRTVSGGTGSRCMRRHLVPRGTVS